MPQEGPPAGAGNDGPAGREHPEHPGDFARRVALRREQLGLTRTEVASRAGMAAEYLTYLEEHASSPSTGSLLRVAAALRTSVAELCGADLPDGPLPRLAASPELEELDPDECREKLTTQELGRISVATESGPAFIPVHYRLAGRAVLLPDPPAALAGRAPETDVVFEADAVDEATDEGWSVLLVGRARPVPAPGGEEGSGRPAGPGRWLSIDPDRITGRRIRRGGT
ncbi:hypothetical protein GCM10009716_37900 [Streptomyces sodiiphilus]|uniref:HTH cro/C1-type domain-containing protein n=1 Tax=Streptomyces sodiiphilus TaxID=226217 RepID=A0ABN2PR21_9ACTN